MSQKADPIIEQQRVLFEADAEPYGFDLTRGEVLNGSFADGAEPWLEYVDRDTGHRWAGWLACALRGEE